MSDAAPTAAARHQEPPVGPFLDVPYQVYGLWVGARWVDVLEARGFPAGVLARLKGYPDWQLMGKSVTAWTDFAAYRAAKGRDSVPDGRAWLEVGPDAKLRLHSGFPNAPRTSGYGRRSRW